MLKYGNGDPGRCAENLLQIVQGELPFDRVRGINSDVVDRPGVEAAFDLEQDALWNIETYEPRVDASNTVVKPKVAEDGSYHIEIQIMENEEDEDE